MLISLVYEKGIIDVSCFVEGVPNGFSGCSISA